MLTVVSGDEKGSETEECIEKEEERRRAKDAEGKGEEDEKRTCCRPMRIRCGCGRNRSCESTRRPEERLQKTEVGVDTRLETSTDGGRKRTGVWETE
jgi:hypothetical protein